MAKIIEAKAVISAEDKTGGVFDKIAKKIDAIGKSAKASVGVEKMNAALEAAQKQLKAIDKFDLSRGAFNASRRQFRDAQQEIQNIARAMRDTKDPSREMQQAYTRAQKTVAAASRDFERQSRALINHKRALEDFGVPINAAAAHQNRLRAAVERTNVALSRQASVSRRGDMLNTAAGAVAGYVGAGTVGRTIGRTVAAGAHYQHEVVGLGNVGRTPAEMRQIEATSRKAVANVPTSTFTENLKVISETTGAFGSLEHAMENLEFVQKANSVVHAVAGDKIQEGPGEMGNKMARFFEMRGTAGNHEVFQKEAEAMVRAMVFSRGNFNPSEMLMFGQQSKGALTNYNERFLGNIAPSLITEMGGERAGTAADAFRNVIMGKVRDKRQTKAWTDLGLLDKKQVIGGEGSPIAWKAGAVQNTDKALADPLQWMEEDMLPALRKAGVDTTDKLALSKAFGTIFRNSMANNFAEKIGQEQQRQRLHKDEKLIGGVLPLDEMYQNNLSKDPTVAMTSLTASLDNLASTISHPAMEKGAGLLSWAGGGLNSLADWGQDHPKTSMAAGVGAGAAGLGGVGWIAYKLTTGFGLTTSAAALDAAAAALMGAATTLNGGSAAKTAAEAVGKSGWLGGALAMGGTVGGTFLGGAAASYYAMNQFKSNPEATGAYSNPMLGAMDPDGAFAASILNGGGRGGANGEWGDVKAELTGSAEVKGEATVIVRIEAGSELLRAVSDARATAKLSGQLNANGPGSTGKSSPDAGSGRSGTSGSF